jgi:hypothetical protein
MKTEMSAVKSREVNLTAELNSTRIKLDSALFSTSFDHDHIQQQHANEVHSLKVIALQMMYNVQ